MESKILLFGKDNWDFRRTKEILIRSGRYEIQVVNTVEQVRSIELNEMSSVILDIDTLGEKQLLWCGGLRQKGFDKPMIFLANQIQIRAYQQIGQHNNMMTLQKTFEPDVLIRALADLRKFRLLKSQMTPRFITNQPVNLMSVKNGLCVTSRIRNYSPGGAFVEYKGVGFRVGDEIQLGFLQDTPKTNERFQLLARIIWIKNSQDAILGKGVGIKFFPAA